MVWNANLNLAKGCNAPVFTDSTYPRRVYYLVPAYSSYSTTVLSCLYHVSTNYILLRLRSLTTLQIASFHLSTSLQSRPCRPYLASQYHLSPVSYTGPSRMVPRRLPIRTPSRSPTMRMVTSLERTHNFWNPVRLRPDFVSDSLDFASALGFIMCLYHSRRI